MTYGANFILTGLVAAAGLVNEKATKGLHNSPQGATVQQAATVKALFPTNAADTSIFSEPSACAATVDGTHAGPVK